jgi:UDP-N-acetylglucosamine 1-carboxyvinyltransferase
MSVIRIVGERRLVGEIDVPGSKNAALAIMSAVLLAEGESVLHHLPQVSDIRIKAELLARFGAKVEWREGSLFVDCSNLVDGHPDEDTVRSIRTSFYMLGPLLARIGKVTMPAPGGCKIGARPVDYHLKGLAAMGAQIDLVEGHYIAKADRLVGANIYLDFPSAGATQHLMTTATLAEGVTTIDNAATEPEVTALADFLNAMGASVEGAGTKTITIVGRKSLSGTSYRIPEDRMQAGTYLLAAAITGGDVTVRNVMPEHQTAVLSKLAEAGAAVEEGNDWIRLQAPHRLKAIRIKTMPHPGFPTDMQQPMAAVLALANGTSVIEETIYESRIGHIAELNRMGAGIALEAGRLAIIKGVEQLSGATVEASDLRAGAALVLAGLAAKGETIVKNVHFIDRGYENLESNLSSLGAIIERIEEDSVNLKEVIS